MMWNRKRQALKWVVPALAVCALGAASVRAQEVVPGPSGASAGEGLTAHGHAEIKVRPDIAYVDVSVLTQARDSARAVRDNAAKAAVLIAALRQAGLADKDIQSQSYWVQPQYDNRHSQAILTGYQVTNSLRVTVRDLTKVGAVIDAATGAGANQVDDVTFDLADRTQAEGRALALAVTEARAKASVMAQAADVPLGHLRDLSEGGSPAFQPQVMSIPPMAPGVERAATPIQSQDITITADVTAFYAVGP